MRALVVLALSGCRGVLGIHEPVLEADDVAPGDGAGVDVAIDAPAGCYGPAGWQLCFDAPPAGSVTLPATLDTDTSMLCQPVPASWTGSGQPDACVIAGASVTVSQDVLVVGSRPLVMVADQTMQITMRLDVASHHITSVGPGANAGACFALVDGASSNAGAGGAAGGSFAAFGGHGGNGTAASGANGAPFVPVPDVLRGGCAGGRGGVGQAANTGGTGGPSGGAVFLVAGGSITITSAVDASGAAGRGSAAGRGGGGGGGSGGMIVLHAPVLDVTGNLLANGGGGGEGSNDGAAGSDGDDPDPTIPLVAATGGAGGSSAAGDGGAGGAGTRDAVAGTNAANGTSSGGGGGGGSVGVIRVLSGQLLAGMASPPPVP